MKKITIEIEETPYQVLVADTDETRERGLMGITHMPKNKGMLFKWDKPGKREFWMKNTVLPLLQCFLNEDMEVVKVLKRQPLDETLMGFDDIQYVLELNADEDVKEGDEMTIEDNNQKVPVMKIIGSDGNVQGIIQGGERIVSRRETVILIKKAKKAYNAKDNEELYNRYCKALGKYMFKVLKGQDSREPQYVSLDNKSKQSPKNEEK